MNVAGSRQRDSFLLLSIRRLTKNVDFIIQSGMRWMVMWTIRPNRKNTGSVLVVLETLSHRPRCNRKDAAACELHLRFRDLHFHSKEYSIRLLSIDDSSSFQFTNLSIHQWFSHSRGLHRHAAVHLNNLMCAINLVVRHVLLHPWCHINATKRTR